MKRQCIDAKYQGALTVYSQSECAPSRLRWLVAEMIAVNTSAIVAMAFAKPERETSVRTIQQADRALVSVVSSIETRGVVRQRGGNGWSGRKQIFAPAPGGVSWLALGATEVPPFRGIEMPVIYLVRHGQTEMNVSQRLQGCRADARLTPLGEAQARRAGEILKRLLSGTNARRVVSSPMGRTQATTSIILDTLGLPRAAFGLDERLREIDYGDWTGLTHAEARQQYKSQWEARANDPWNVPPTNGESYSEVAGRAAEWLHAQDDDVVAVAHGVFGRILRGVVLGLDGHAIRALPEPHDCVFRISAATVECHEGGA